MPEIDIPRITQPAVQEFARSFLTPSRPVVIQGAIDDWPARKLWNPGYFREKVGDVTITVLTCDQDLDLESSLRIDSILASRREKITIKDLLDNLDSDGPYHHYVGGMPIASSLPDLMPDIKVPAYHVDPSATKARMWLGGPFIGPLHFDRTDNLHAVVHGRKHFRLLPPGESRRLYPSSLRSIIPHISQASFHPEDYDRFPRMRGAKSVELELEAGDMLFIPAGWWHQVTTPVLTISVDHMWPVRTHLSPQFLRLVPWRMLRRIRGHLGLK